MGTTPNYNIPYPEITDFVSDGATAMEAIADKVDDILSTGTPARNLLINGAMQVAQRGTSVSSITSGAYRTADRFNTSITSMGTWTETIEDDAPSGSGFRKSLKILCTTADATPASGDICLVRQLLEGQDLQVIRKGTASAEKLTFSFWVKSNVTGTYIVELRDNDNIRAVSASYTISASETWEKKVITFPADTTGAFDNDNQRSLDVIWGLGAGTTYTSGTLQTAWSSITNADRYVGQVNLAGATNNYWQMTGAQLTVGATDVPFQFKSFANELADCQRYYQRETDTAVVMHPDQAGSPSVTRYASVQFPVYMRNATYTASGTTGVGAPSIYKKAISGCIFSRSVGTSSLGTDLASWIVDGEL